MTRRPRTRFAALLLPLLAVAAPARAQRIDGRLVSARDSTPVAGALVQLLTAGGARVTQSSSGADGAFRLPAPSAGRYVVAVLRIGQHPWRAAPADLTPGVALRLTYVVPDDPIQLAAIAVEAHSACRVSPGSQSLIGDLLAEAQKALTLTQLAIGRREGGYGVLLWHKILTLDLVTVDSTPEYAVNVSWPIRSAPVETLAAHGFASEPVVSDDHPLGVTTWYGPDAAVLFSSWFLNSHCFRVSAGAGQDQGAVVLAFDPARGGRGTDITGRLVIDRATLALQRIEWRYVGVPWWVNADAAGGALTLVRLPSGAIFPSHWWMRAPVPEVDGALRPVKLHGWAESGGEILREP